MEWISAHRQTWFSSNAMTLSPQEKRNSTHIRQQRHQSRVAPRRLRYTTRKHCNPIDAENVRARSIVAVDGNIDLAKTLAKKDALIKIINESFNIPIEISVRESDQVVASKCGGIPIALRSSQTGT